MEMKIGDKVILPKLPGEFQPRRKGTVIAEHDTYFLIQMAKGYKDTVHKTELRTVRVL